MLHVILHFNYLHLTIVYRVAIGPIAYRITRVWFDSITYE